MVTNEQVRIKADLPRIALYVGLVNIYSLIAEPNYNPAISTGIIGRMVMQVHQKIVNYRTMQKSLRVGQIEHFIIFLSRH